ncbi:substrate-binding periplasmic protein [Shewanella colwelliana]|uniref:substrate-binding periplasmic protein n=1 Tax=Shewanella colwelliana TaxID=23 RepID=UPI0022B055B9|nr:transporter substrate-binding domain-containing protein [Shewanella colwelliana]MCZ4336651.1 transporter substrate-binding domain-containing protein [Shewanella colwelliana]
MTRVLGSHLLIAVVLLVNTCTVSAKPAVLASDVWCPYVCDTQASQRGYVLELTERALELAGQESRFEIQPFLRTLENGRQSKVDIVLAVTAEHLNEYQLTSSSSIIGRYSNDFYVSKSDQWQYQAPNSLLAKNVAAIQGYTYGQVLDNFLFTLPSLYLASGQSPLEMNLQRLIKGRVSIILGNRHVIEYVAAEQGLIPQIRYAGSEGESMPLFIGFSQNAVQEGLLERFETGLKLLKQSGEYQQILARYRVSF